MVFQFIKVLILRPELLEVIVARESIEISEDGVTLHMTRIVEVDMFRVGIH